MNKTGSQREQHVELFLPPRKKGSLTVVDRVKTLLGMSSGSDSGRIGAEPPREVGMSQWALMRLKFFKNKLAVTALVILIVIYIVIALAEFFGPYDISTRNRNYLNAPPMRIRLFHAGELIGPFVYPYEQTQDPQTFLRVHEPMLDNPIPVRFFVHAESHKLLGLIPTNLRLYGLDSEEHGIYILGTDRLGRDVYSRVLAGARVSLSAGFLGVIISLVIGSALGTASGYFGGWIDNVIQRVIELIQSFPNIPLWLTLSAALPPEWSSITIYFGIVTILGLIGWTTLGREIRGKVIAMRSLDYVHAARAAGGTHWWAIRRHLIPNALSHIIVVATLAIPGMILGEASLSFLGLGIRPPMTSLGVMLQEAQNIRTIVNQPWLFAPGIVIIVAILCFNFLGDGLRDAADPFSH